MEIQSIKHLQVMNHLLTGRKEHLIEENKTLSKTINLAPTAESNSIIQRIALLNQEELTVIDELMEGITHELQRG